MLRETAVVQRAPKVKGAVDNVFVLSWNRDNSTFSSIIECSAYDMHAFIVYVNNRMYGDTRLRTPYHESYDKDMLRARGGINDYFLLAKLDVHGLRVFQNTVITTAAIVKSEENEEKRKRYKTLPDGYVVHSHRK